MRIEQFENGVLRAFRTQTFLVREPEAELIEMRVKEGEMVDKGDLLFRFDTAQLEQQMKMLTMRTNLLARQIAAVSGQLRDEKLKQARIELMHARTGYEDAARDEAIGKEMLEAGLMSEADASRAMRASESAKMALDIATGELATLEEEPEPIEATKLRIDLLRTEAEMGELHKRMGFYTGIAPFAGKVLRVNEAVKQYAGDAGSMRLRNLAGGSSLLVMADTSQMRIQARFFESDAAQIREGQSATVSSENMKGKISSGEVTSVGQLGFAHGQSSTVAVEARVKNPKDELKPGLTAELRVLVEHLDAALVIPVRFLHVEGKEQHYVWRMKGGQAARTPVKIGVSNDEVVEIVEGLDEGDEIAVE